MQDDLQRLMVCLVAGYVLMAVAAIVGIVMLLRISRALSYLRIATDIRNHIWDARFKTNSETFERIETELARRRGGRPPKAASPKMTSLISIPVRSLGRDAIQEHE